MLQKVQRLRATQIPNHSQKIYVNDLNNQTTDLKNKNKKTLALRSKPSWKALPTKHDALLSLSSLEGEGGNKQSQDRTNSRQGVQTQSLERNSALGDVIKSFFPKLWVSSTLYVNFGAKNGRLCRYGQKELKESVTLTHKLHKPVRSNVPTSF